MHGVKVITIFFPKQHSHMLVKVNTHTHSLVSVIVSYTLFLIYPHKLTKQKQKLVLLQLLRHKGWAGSRKGGGEEEVIFNYK